MRSARRALAAVLAAVVLLSCSSEAEEQPVEEKPSEYVATGAWDAAYMRVIRGLSGSFRSLVVGEPCEEPQTAGSCLVGGAQISQVGDFTLGPDSARYEYRAFGLDADLSEASGYRVIVEPGTHVTRPGGAGFLSVMGRTTGGGCWAKSYSPTAFGSRWSLMPVGFSVLLDADAVEDPLAGDGPKRFTGTADVQLVLEFLGLESLYDAAAREYSWRNARVPLELRVRGDGLPLGFAVAGDRVALALVGPEPTDGGTSAASVRAAERNLDLDARIRHALRPMNGEFLLSDLGKKRTIKAPPKDLVSAKVAEGDDPCPGR